jgi:hypothetical protein
MGVIAAGQCRGTVTEQVEVFLLWRPTSQQAWREAEKLAAVARRLKLPWRIGVRKQGSGQAVYAVSTDPSVPVLPESLPGWTG